MWTAILSVSSAVLSSCCLIATMFLARRARHDSAPAAAQIRSVTSRIASLSESLEATQVELERLSNRVKMQRVRNVTEHSASGPRPPGDVPDPYTDPDAWRKHMSRKLAMQKVGS